jgi:cell division protein FtsQ
MMIRRTKGNRKWEERPQLYRGRFFYFRQIAAVALWAAAVVAVVAIVVFFHTSPALHITQLEVLGEHPHLTDRQIAVLSGIHPNDNLFALDFETVRARLLRHPWIANVQLRREFPGTVRIHVIEHQPFALLLASKLYLVSATGKIFKQTTTRDSRDLPVITGFTAEDLRSYPQLSLGRLKSSLAFLKSLLAQPFYRMDPPSEVHFDPILGFTVHTRDAGLEIYYGLAEPEKRHAKLETFTTSKDFANAVFVRIDLDSKDRIVARRY